MEINEVLCSYDIDIFNLFVKYSHLYEKYKNESIKKQYTMLESIYYYLGYDKPEPISLCMEYFEKKSDTVNVKIRDVYLKLFNIIIN